MNKTIKKLDNGDFEVVETTQSTDKQHAHIEDWAIVGYGEYKFLVGRVSSHPKQEDFEKPYQRTSMLVSVDEVKGVAETINTTYTLGLPRAMKVH
jgi:hypothetical protein